MSNHKIIIIVCSIALLLRLLLLQNYPKVPELVQIVEGGDSIGYLQLATSLITNQGYKFAEGGYTAFRMPGYPLLLAAFYGIWSQPLGVQLFQIFIDVFMVFVIYQLSQSLFRNQMVSTFAAILVALYPLIVVSSISLLPETLSLVLISSVMFLLVVFPNSRRGVFLVPLILGATVYLKPTMFVVAGIYLLLFTLFLLSKPNKNIVVLVLPILLFGATLVPWVVRNALVMGTIIPLTTSNGSNLFGGNNPQANGGYVSSGSYVISEDEVESNRILTERAFEWIRNNPSSFLKLLPAKAFRFFWPLAFGTSGNVDVPRIVFLSVLVSMILFYSFALVGVSEFLSRRRIWELSVLISTPLALLALSLLTFGAARFSLPAFPALAILASSGMAVIIKRMILLTTNRKYLSS